jgi:CRP/FNR family cyclic AMP-dependent transcriptional regulator
MAGISLDQKCKALSKVPLFSQLSAKDIDAIASMATTRKLKARQALFRKGDAGAQVFVVATGRLKVVSTSELGDDLVFCLVEPGELVGEVGLLTERKRTATVVALAASELIVIDRRDFGALLRSRPEVAVELLSVVAQRLARVSQFLEDTQFLNLPVRLAKKIIDFADQHGIERDGLDDVEIVIDLTLSQEEWGDLVGTTRESINKQFGAWAKEGLIALEKRKVVLRDVEAMRSLADCVVL